MMLPSCGCRHGCQHRIDARRGWNLPPQRECKSPVEASTKRPVCLIAVTVVPLDKDGLVDTMRTVTVSGIGGVMAGEEQLTVTWFNNKRAITCTISGNPEVLRS